MRTGLSFTVSPTDRTRLSALVRDRNAPQKHVWRAEIVLLSVEGVGTVEIVRRTGKSKTCVWRWQERFAAEGYEGLLRDKTRPSRIPPLGPEVAERVVALTLADPPGETTHWTADMMAKEAGISASAVRRIWKAHGLAPHRWRQFKLPNDPKFVDKSLPQPARGCLRVVARVLAARPERTCGFLVPGTKADRGKAGRGIEPFDCLGDPEGSLRAPVARNRRRPDGGLLRKRKKLYRFPEFPQAALPSPWRPRCGGYFPVACAAIPANTASSSFASAARSAPPSSA